MSQNVAQRCSAAQRLCVATLLAIAPLPIGLANRAAASPDDASPPAAATDELLTIGSRAPSLDIEHWVQDGGGRFKPFQEFEAGKVYVVEFWATWCGPCISSMPHLAEVQEKYADQGVTIVGVSDESLETVEEFLDRPAPAGGDEAEGEPQTFRDVTRPFCLATDPDGSMQQAYMEAAAQNGIPCAFLIGKDGHIEWIGHSMAVDKPLAQVLSDEWDRVAFAEEFTAKQLFEAALSKAMRLARTDQAAAREELQRLADTAPNEMLKGQATQMLQQLELVALRGLLATDPGAAGEKLVAMLSADASPGVVYGLANLVANADEPPPLGDEAFDALLAAVQKQIDDEVHPIFYRTKAELTRQRGDLDGAIAIMETVIESKSDTPGIGEYFSSYLEELQAAKAKSEPAETEPAETAEAESSADTAGADTAG